MQPLSNLTLALKLWPTNLTLALTLTLKLTLNLTPKLILTLELTLNLLRSLLQPTHALVGSATPAAVMSASSTFSPTRSLAHVKIVHTLTNPLSKLVLLQVSRTLKSIKIRFSLKKSLAVSISIRNFLRLDFFNLNN